MAGVSVEAGSELAQAIQAAVQPKLMESGWVAEENDTTLSEYVTMMVVAGKDARSVMSELGGDLLGIGEDDADVGAFAQWLFEQVRMLAGAAQNSTNDAMNVQASEQQAQTAVPTQELHMGDSASTEDVPSGPKAMRNGAGGRGGRGGRLLGQMNNHMNRTDLPDPLRRIKGAAAGQQGRINAHAPRGPKAQNMANGLQRMMNGNGRGGMSNVANSINPGIPGNMMGGLDQQQQMTFMQMMEMQANLMTQMMSGQFQPAPQNGQPSGSLFDRVEQNHSGKFKGRQQKPRDTATDGDGDSGMEVDTDQTKKEPFETVCRFNIKCTIPTCPFAHQSPAAPQGQTIDMSDTCTFGAACENRKCAGRHPSPAQRAQHHKQEVDCRFFPNCTNPSCPFRHPDMPLCRNGADCNVPGCKFTHSKILCRYTPCQRPFCPYKHTDGQRGVYKDKVWVKDGAPNAMDIGEGEDDRKSNRFAEFKENEAQPEELIIPGQQQSANSQTEGDANLIT